MTRLGYQIPNFTYPGVEPADLYDEVARQAKEADGSGFDTVLVMDHFFQLPMLGPPDHFMLECYSLLSALARDTSTVRLSGLVTGNTYRNPAVLAKTVTTLDIVSGGRAQLGIGAGWFELEHQAFGIEFGTFTDRFEKLEEALQIIIPMLRGERVSLDGKHYQVVDAFNSPPPVSRVPVLIGGSGERKTLRMVAQYADESNLICGREEVGRKLDALAEHCRMLGRDRSELTVSWQRSVCIAPTTDEAMSDLRDGLRANGLDLDSMPEDQQTAITERFIVGDPDTVGAQLADDLALGVDGFTINLPVNGHVPGRVALLGETASKVIAT
ncbi:MAG: LLM class F420-dependent oxidoreductase [Acidimicrobiia bacterium]|nr:LLM class F420-dependent oxidoreductase [Acidimicrobiia bacterium]